MQSNDAVFTGQACGKIILSGEHSVVYGKPCIASSIPIYLHVQLKTSQTPTSIELCYKDAPPYTIDQRLKDAVFHIIPQHGWEVKIRSHIPFSSGMGSSAALGIALLRAWTKSQNEDWRENPAQLIRLSLVPCIICFKM